MQARRRVVRDWTHVAKLEAMSTAVDDALQVITKSCYGAVCVVCNDLCDEDLKCVEGHDLCPACIVASGGSACLARGCEGVLPYAAMVKSPFSGVRALV